MLQAERKIWREAGMIQAERKIWREGCYKPKGRSGGRDDTSRRVDLEGGMIKAERKIWREAGMIQAER